MSNDKDEWQEMALRKREQFNTGVMEVMMQKLTTVEARQDVAEWIAYHSAHETAIITVWKREALSAKVRSIPQLLFLAGDVIQLTATSAPTLAAGIGKLLPRLVVTLLNKAAKEPPKQLQDLHRAVHDLIATLSASPYLPREWVTGMHAALEASVEQASAGWVHEGLQGVDRMWTEAREAYSQSYVTLQRLDEQYEGLRQRKVEGTPQQLRAMLALADSYLAQCDGVSQKLVDIGRGLDESVLEDADAGLAELERAQETLKRGRDASADELLQLLSPKAKAARLSLQKSPSAARDASAGAAAAAVAEDDASLSSDDESSDDGPRFTLGKK